MTESQKNIIEDLKFIGHSFENISIKYEFQSYSNSHLIEILPADLFENESYNELEWDLKERFYSGNKAEESLVFFTKGQLVSLTGGDLLYSHSRDLIHDTFYTRRIYSNALENYSRNSFILHPNSIVIDYNEHLNSRLQFDVDQLFSHASSKSSLFVVKGDIMENLKSINLRYNVADNQIMRTPNIDNKLDCLV